MVRDPLFNNPLWLGFEDLEALLDRIARHGAEAYPPYNVEQMSGSRLRITLAVAGFAAEDLQVQVQDRQLTVHGRQPEQQERIYVHRGIARRQFLRSFVLAEGLEVRTATLERGLLHIELERLVVASELRIIAIETKAAERVAEAEQEREEPS